MGCLTLLVSQEVKDHDVDKLDVILDRSRETKVGKSLTELQTVNYFTPHVEVCRALGSYLDGQDQQCNLGQLIRNPPQTLPLLFPSRNALRVTSIALNLLLHVKFSRHILKLSRGNKEMIRLSNDGGFFISRDATPGI